MGLLRPSHDWPGKYARFSIMILVRDCGIGRQRTKVMGKFDSYLR